MGRFATTIEEQIEKLAKRGMNFDCGIEKAKEHLLDIGYYRLGFYWFPFEIDKEHNFAPQTNFSTIINLYYLDIDLRFLLMKALNRIEINLRTQLIYCISNKYKDSPTWFSDPKVMHSKFVENFPKYYTPQFVENNHPLKKHHRKYINDIYAPAWKTIEFLTFGNLYSIFHNLKNEELQQQIARYYGIKKVAVFTNYFRTIIFIRNICAHGGLLYDVNTPLGIKLTPLIKTNDNNRHSLNTAIQVILYFLGRISKNRRLDLEKAIGEIFYGFNAVIGTIYTPSSLK